MSNVNQLVVEWFNNYLSTKEEMKGDPCASTLSDEFKEKTGLSIFPEDLQDDILRISQKLIEYAVTVVVATSRDEEEAKDTAFGYHLQNFPKMPTVTRYTPPEPSILDKLSRCNSMRPEGELWSEISSTNSTLGGIGTGALTSLLTASNPITGAAALGAMVTPYLAGRLAWTIGCMKNSPKFGETFPSSPTPPLPADPIFQPLPWEPEGQCVDPGFMDPGGM
jgi:hypothetical protein